jgi:hypothetical protein
MSHDYESTAFAFELYKDHIYIQAQTILSSFKIMHSHVVRIRDVRDQLFLVPVPVKFNFLVPVPVPVPVAGTESSPALLEFKFSSKKFFNTRFFNLFSRRLAFLGSFFFNKVTSDVQKLTELRPSYSLEFKRWSR